MRSMPPVGGPGKFARPFRIVRRPCACATLVRIAVSPVDGSTHSVGLMKATAALVLVLILASLPVFASACSFALSGPFKASARNGSDEAPVSTQLKSVELFPNIGKNENDSCWGVGFIVVTLTGKPFRTLKRQGYIVRPLSGLHDPGLFPSDALTPRVAKRGTVTLTWGWTGVTPDSDGHLRWRFELVPVSPAGVRGEPLQVCVATDDSCPPRVDSEPGPDGSSKPMPRRGSTRASGPQ